MQGGRKVKELSLGSFRGCLYKRNEADFFRAAATAASATKHAA